MCFMALKQDTERLRAKKGNQIGYKVVTATRQSLIYAVKDKFYLPGSIHPADKWGTLVTDHCKKMEHGIYVYLKKPCLDTSDKLAGHLIIKVHFKPKDVLGARTRPSSLNTYHQTTRKWGGVPVACVRSVTVIS